MSALAYRGARQHVAWLLGWAAARALILAGVALPGQADIALETGAGVGLEYSDNIERVEDNEQDAWVQIGQLAVDLSRDEGNLTGNAASSFTYEHYTAAFGDRYRFNLNGAAEWRILPERLTWTLSDNFSQVLQDSLEADTPTNQQNTNIFSTGPDLLFRLSPVHNITLSPRYQNAYYQKQDNDNQRYELRGTWSYTPSNTLTLGLNGDAIKVDFDKDDINPNYNQFDYFLSVASQQARSNLSLLVGGSYIDRDRVGNNSGFLGGLNWDYTLNSFSSLRVFARSRLTDSSSIIRLAATNPDEADVRNLQVSGDVIRDKIVGLGYARAGTILTTNLQGSYNKLDYKESPNDREIWDATLSLSHPLSATLSTSLTGRYSRTKETDTGRRDKQYDIRLGLHYQIRPDWTLNLDLGRDKKDSTEEGQGYTELRGLLSLVYGIGSIGRR